MNEARPIVLRVDGAHEGRRVDAVVGEIEAVGSRAEAQRCIDAGRVRVDGEVVRKRHLVRAGQTVEVLPIPRASSELEPEPMDLPVVYADEHMLVVDKPAGVVTHPSRGHDRGTLVHGLLALGAAGGDADRPGIVHRLDRDTSGLLVVARTPRAHRRLQAMLRERLVDRRYAALVHGAFPPAMAVDRPIGRDRRNRIRMSTNTDRPRDARTRFRRLAAYERPSLLEARLDTGRTHQIRVHLEAAGYPVVGDPVYGRPQADGLGLTRQFLHAWRLDLPHPETDEPLNLTSPLPADLVAALTRLGAGPPSPGD